MRTLPIAHGMSSVTALFSILSFELPAIRVKYNLCRLFCLQMPRVVHGRAKHQLGYGVPDTAGGWKYSGSSDPNIEGAAERINVSL